MLTQTYHKYSGHVDSVIAKGVVLPDIMLDVIRDVTRPVLSNVFNQHLTLCASDTSWPDINTHRILIPTPSISLQDTCRLVIDAFRWVDDTLGKKVEDVIHDHARIDWFSTEKGQAWGQCILPRPDGLARAKICYFCDETINDALYVAHELGHLLSADLAQEEGYADQKAWMPQSVDEIPAMITQMMMYDYLMNQQHNEDLQDASRRHFIAECTRYLYTLDVACANPYGHPVAQDDFENVISASLGHQWNFFHHARDRALDSRDAHTHPAACLFAAGFYAQGMWKTESVFNAVFKQGCDSDIFHMFASMGVTEQEALTSFISNAVYHMLKPVEEAYTAMQTPTRSVALARMGLPCPSTGG